MKRFLLIAVALAATLATSCSGDIDKSGGAAGVTTLQLASFEGSLIEHDPALAQFVQLVDQLSDGRLRIEVPSSWFGAEEMRVLEDVAAGKAALGWTGTRAVDLVGVDTFQPLHAPYLVGSYEAERTVVADRSLTQEMLAGLDDAGLVGLAVLADELRLPVAATAPRLGPGDFANREFAIFPSQVQADAVTALGGRPVDDPRAQARETSWPVYLRNHMDATMPFVTANAALWPRTTVLVANPAELAKLSDAERAVLERAAAEATDWSVAHADDRVPAEMNTACARGVRIATASSVQLRALRRAVEPVYAVMRGKPEQAPLLARVEELVRDAGAPEPLVVPDGCAYRAGEHRDSSSAPEPLVGPGRPGGLPAGTYRYVLTEDEINAAIPPDDDAWDMAGGNAGVWTWTLANGRWLLNAQLSAQEVPEGFDTGPCEGFYDVRGDEIDFTTVTEYEHGDCAPATWTATWRQVDNGLAMDANFGAGDNTDFLFDSKIWERID